MISADLQKAIDTLVIQDVYVHDQIANCAEDFDPKYPSVAIEKLTFQQMQNIKHFNIAELDEKVLVLRVFMRFGARWVDLTKEKELSIKAIIEAEFIAEYQMIDELEDESIHEFCHKNVIYHVWPYWRELLSNQCIRMHLPRVILSTM